MSSKANKKKQTTSNEVLSRINDWLRNEGREEEEYEELKQAVYSLEPNATPDKSEYIRLAEMHKILGLPLLFWGDRPPLKQFKWRYAAVFFPLLIALGITGLWRLLSNSADHMITLSVTETEKTILLPDGSKAIISPGSEFSYPDQFEEERVVILNGQAMFYVVKCENEQGKTRPFVVETENLTNYVHGTDFQVTSFKGTKHSQVALYSGKISVEANGTVTDLEYGELFRYDSQTLEINMSMIPVEEMIGNGYKPRLKFEETCLGDIIRSIELNYDIKFENRSGANLNTGRFTVDFEKENLESIVQLLSLISKDFLCTKENNRVIISLK